MCGISGYVHSDTTFALGERRLRSMRDSLAHRGPDDAGLFVGPGVGLGSRRLAILDLSPLGHMPMSTPDGRYTTVYNGEVYNYRELRDELIQQGVSFRSNTDTEVVLRLYERYGPDMLPRLNGMFAIAVWDAVNRELFLARDRLGVKPLYYATSNGAFMFASEQKALFEAGVSPSFDASTWTELLCFRYVAGPKTPFKGVFRLLGGHWLRWRNGDTVVRRWWDLAARTRERRAQIPANPVKWYTETFDSSVGYRRISDVPVGVLLSGGLDSGSVAASLASQSRSPVASFTVRFADRSHDEGPLAQEVAARAGLEYHELTVRDDDLVPELARASYLNDEPLVHGNDLHLLAISRYARPEVRVLLSGEGADETLGGYVRYRPLRHPNLLRYGRGAILGMAAAGIRAPERLKKLARFVRSCDIRQMVLFNACDVLPGELGDIGMVPDTAFEFREAVLDESTAVYPDEPVRQAMYSDQHTFLSSLLDRNDRMTMGSSIECRVPFLDYRLVEGVAALPTRHLLSWRRGKLLLRRGLAHRLPESVRRHPKWGFHVPWEQYLRRVPELRDLLLHLPDCEPFLSGPFERRKLRTVLERFLAGDNTSEMLVRQMAMIAVWYSAVCDRRPAQDEYDDFSRDIPTCLTTAVR